MSENGYQDDLFGGNIQHKKVPRPRILDRYQKQRILPQIRVPVEYTVIGAIAVLVLMVIAYAVGVEKGKTITKIKDIKMVEPSAVIIEEQPAVKPYPPDEYLEMAGEGGDEVPLDEEGAGQIGEGPEEPAAAEDELSVYIIQLASFKNETSAIKEADILMESGIDARVSRKGEWFQVFAAGYNDIDEAARAKRDLAEKYADCYIRRTK